MKLNSKIKLTTLSLAVLGVLVTVPTAQAANEPGNICTQLNNITGRIQDNLKNLDAGPRVHSGDDLNRLEQAATQKLADRRADWDKLRSEHYKKLNERAKNDTQHQAVETYKSTIESAVTKRRTAVDAAITSFRAVLDSLVSNDQSRLAQLAQTYKSNIDAALQKAQSDCQNGESPETVRTNLAAELKAAHDNLLSPGSGVNKLHNDIENSRQTRSGVISEAVEEFKQTAQTAREALERALGQ